MQLKEKLSSASSGKSLIGTFFATEMMDMAMTKADLTLFHGSEINPMGGAELLNNLGQQDLFILKIALSAILVGAYALASLHEKDISMLSQKIKPKYVIEKGLQGATVFMAGVLSWDALNIGFDVISAIKL